jgi:phosphohistidine phosphatase
MDLLLVRHAQAVPRAADASGMRDAARRLTKRGRDQLSRTVRGLERLGLTFDRILYSPKLRSIETANALSSLLNGESTVTRLLCVPPSDQLLAEIHGERVAVVGHEPHLSALVAMLAGAPVSIRLKPSGVAWLDGDPRPGGMRLRALLPPRVLRALANR